MQPRMSLLLILAACACRPASYTMDVRVEVPRGDRDGVADEPESPSQTDDEPRVLRPAHDVVIVPHGASLPRGIKTIGPPLR